jgi:hypothetical protein
MSSVIDVDAHSEPGGDWLAPYPGLAARLPKLDPALLAMDSIVGDLLRDVPPELRPHVARNVRATPLSGGNDSPLPKIMAELPDDVIVLSSDFPHLEGFTNPMGHYAEALKELAPVRRERFFGGSIAEVYRRMGDPIVTS